ncbi:hypothetical protein [Nakamurella lactea]|uniref:hypothetical protein n=1 Tax=Nakamurella lactea TaxID=459515 RepID=UPI00048AEE93|nr:hypothetical protein [Nakamurella lactea]
MRRLFKIGAVLAVALGISVGAVIPAAAAHYQGGDYGYCAKPENAAYDGVWVEAWGVGSDVPRRNALVAAVAFVGLSSNHNCKRSGAVYHVVRVQIDKVAVRQNNKNYHTVGPVNKGKPYAQAQSGGAAIKCGTYAQSAVRYSVRYSNNALFTGYLNSAGFRRC